MIITPREMIKRVKDTLEKEQELLIRELNASEFLYNPCDNYEVRYDKSADLFFTIWNRELTKSKSITVADSQTKPKSQKLIRCDNNDYSICVISFRADNGQNRESENTPCYISFEGGSYLNGEWRMNYKGKCHITYQINKNERYEFSIDKEIANNLEKANKDSKMHCTYFRPYGDQENSEYGLDDEINLSSRVNKKGKSSDALELSRAVLPINFDKVDSQIDNFKL